MANLCIIPARGGSKRIPRKNIKEFLGKPIISYSIEVALKSGLFDEVMVSTDDEEIATISKQYGAKIPFTRSKENANDYATTFDVIQEVLSSYKDRGSIFEKVCCIYPCAPFVSVDVLKKSFFKLQHYDVVFPIISFGFPIQRALKKEGDTIEFFYPKYALSRSQDLETSYHDAGQFYFFKVNEILKSGKLLTNNTGGVEISEMEAQDIDNEIDWKLAELKFKLLNKIS